VHLVIGCGATTGAGAGVYSAKIEAGAKFGLGGISLNLLEEPRWSCGQDYRSGSEPRSRRTPKKIGMTHLINPNDIPKAFDHIVQLTDGGAHYVRMHRQH
jgi:S-(hydroxymethyl)glutathione dehydrogenase/alcohol dehydrogenase